MPLITEYYKIKGPVPFVDVETSTDNDLYLDPRAVRRATGPQPYVKDALHCADTFLGVIVTSVINGDPDGEEVLQRFKEPWETRLGMAEKGFAGHGGAEDIGSRIWGTMTGDVEALVRIGVLHQLEDLALFVRGVDKDITSDVTTRIMYGPLADFTAEMVARFPEFTANGEHVETFRKQVWNPVTSDWELRDVTLPVVNGKELLLVPKNWVRKNLLMSAGRFYDTTVLSFAQLEQAAVASNGKVLKPRKEDLKKQQGLSRGRGTIIRVTKRAIESAEDLVREFKKFVDSKYEEPNEGDAVA